MITANLLNTEHGINVTVGILSLPSFSDNQFFLGSNDRTIDGTLISYSNGHKKEVTISAENMSKADINSLRTAQRNQYELVFTITDEYLNETFLTYTGILEAFDPEYNTRSRLYSASLRVLEI